MNKQKVGTLEYWKHKCKVKELECDWLDELCNYERETQYQLNGDTDEWKREIDELENKHHKEIGKFNKLYNA